MKQETCPSCNYMRSETAPCKCGWYMRPMTPIKPVSEMSYLSPNPRKDRWEDVVPAEYAQQLWDWMQELEQSFWKNEAHIKEICGKSVMSYPAVNAVRDILHERDSLRQQLDERIKQINTLNNVILSLAASEAQLRKALDEIGFYCAGDELTKDQADQIAKRVSACLSTPPSEALRPWVKFVKETKNYLNNRYEPEVIRHANLKMEATQLLSSINEKV